MKPGTRERELAVSRYYDALDEIERLTGELRKTHLVDKQERVFARIRVINIQTRLFQITRTFDKFDNQ